MNKFLFWCLVFVDVFDFVFIPLLLVLAVLSLVICLPACLAIIACKACKDGPKNVFYQLKGREA